MIDVIAGFGLNDLTLEKITNKIELAAPHVEWIQLDIGDGTLIPGKTYMEFAKLKPVIERFPHLSFEAHLMVDEPEKYITPLSDVGFKRLIAHIECTDPRIFIDEAQFESVEVGLGIDGPTELEQLEPFLDMVDTVLVMTIEMGASGKPFMPETIEKIKLIHENLPDLPIEVDGGMNDVTSGIVRDAGAIRIVSTSYLYKDPVHIATAVKKLKGK